ncbi:hypothetical protein HRI_003749700 [Hibiscus trionum]|uniref:Cardiomyopathy-associated protein 5 n=1 Tax=Hibiscus trionum TaxID=183268 RepID=A0A9W7MI68_HIBTR|nr:hypothetical protein HRI_003749700 [Hibiscus trionum]
MSIDAKGIQHLLWKPITVSASCCYRYVRKHPVVLGSPVFVFFLYIWFPLVFYYLMCSSPIIVCTFVSIRFYLKTKHPESKLIQRKNGDKKSNVAAKRSNKPSLSVRRNARMEVLEWNRKDGDEMNNFSPTTPYGIANLFREEMKMYSPRSPYGLGSLFSIPNSLDENPNSISDEKGRNGMEHGGSSSNIEATNDRALDNKNLRSGDSFQGHSGTEEMERFSPRTPYGIANLFREEMKMYSPRSPYCLSSLFSNPNFLEENPKSIFDENGRNSMEHEGTSSNIEMANDRALDDKNLRSTHSFQEQSAREEMDRFSPRTPYGIANLFREEMKMYSPRTPYGIANLFREEMKVYSPRSPYGLSSLFSNPNFLEEDPKSIFDEKGRNSMEHGGSSSNIETGNDQALDDDSFQGQSGRGPNGGGQVELESMDEEDGGKKAVEWTEEDRKNVMVLGSLELERNQRLESLMARRRARKLFKMTVDKSRMNMDAILPSHLAPIQTAKSNLGLSIDSCEEVLQMPGSAPSYLLPYKNPFDLPYDPHEEKPNLMADSFQQEFMIANQKEYCRHESFCRKTYLTRDSDGDHFNHYYCTRRSLVEGPTDPRFRWQSVKGGGHHHHNSSSIASDLDRIELDDSNHNKGMNSSERALDGTKIGEKMDIGRNEVKMEMDSINNNDSCYTSSSEDTESVSDQTSKSSGIRRKQMRNKLNLLVPPKGRSVHTLPYDFSPSPNERPRSDFNLFYGTYRLNRPVSTCSIASDLQVEVSEVGSPPLITDASASSADGDSVTYDGDVDKDINSDGEEVWGSSFNLSRGEANGEKLRELHDIIEEDSVEVDASGLKRELEKPNASPSPSEQEAKHVLDSKGSVASHPKDMNPETQEDTKNVDEIVDGLKTLNVSDQLSPENPGETMHLMEKPITQRDSTIVDSKSSENRENEAQILVEASREMKKPAEAIGPGSTEHSRGNLETFYESKTPFESEKKIEGSQPSMLIEDTRNLEPKHDTGDAPSAVQSRDNLIENTISGSNQRFDGSSSMVLNRRLVIEQIPENSFSSPRSVLPENVLEDEILPSDVEQPQVDLTYHMPQNAQQLAENSMDQLSGSSSLITLEEPTNSSRKGTVEGNIGVNINDSVVNKKDEEAKSTANQGESQFSIGPEVIHGPEKSNQHEANVKTATLQSVEGTKHGTEVLAEVKANASLSTSAGESDSLNNIKNGEKIQNLTGHDGIIDAPQSKEDNHNANNHKVAMEASKPTESEVKPVEPEGNGSNAVAK